MKVYIGADHRGFERKEALKQSLTTAGFEVEDRGNTQHDPEDDYVDFATAVSQSVLADPDSKGILLCGSGVGVDMAANKIKGIRSALVFDTARAVQSRQHEDINVLSLPADILDDTQALEIATAYLNTPFSGEERHKRRLEKLRQLEA